MACNVLRRLRRRRSVVRVGPDGPAWDRWFTPEGESDPLRHQVLAEVYQEIAASHPATVRVVDLASWYSRNELDADRDARPDGVHLAPDVATSITDRFLGDQLIAAALR